MRRWRGGTGVLARGYYKGGFEAKMNRREAALILEVPYVILLYFSLDSVRPCYRWYVLLLSDACGGGPG
jgi:DnaJ homolog subfamily C member 19